MSVYLTIVLLLLLYTQVFLRVQFLALCFFTVYIKPFSAIIDSQSVIHNSFADDLRLQMYAPLDKIYELRHSMQSCIGDFKAWATANMLERNDNTELMLVTSKRTKHLHSLPT